MSGASVRYNIRFTGQVQGVGFRATAVSEARGLAVHGFVRNEPDGSVRLDADGPRSDLDELVHRIKTTMNDHLRETTIDVQPSRNRSGGLTIAF